MIPIQETSTASPQVLVVEDDDLMRLSVADRFRIEGIPAAAAASLAEARRLLSRGQIEVVVTDIRLPDGTGRDLFEDIARSHSGIPVVLMTAFGSIPEAVELVKSGAADYLTKPFKPDALVSIVRRCLDDRRDRRLSAQLRAADGRCGPAGTGVLGRSLAMRTIEQLVARIAPLDSSVLITGESGAGKEVVADLIHHSSPRAGAPFVKVNCAAIPLNLVESELFGHEKGAFTGADRRWIGRFEQAQGGTLFLDEIAEIPPETQVKLLRVLQERSVQRVGGRETIRLDVRVIAATQVDLKAAIESGRFRGDLYWRLNVFHIAVPPLRERGDDVLFLARHFAREFAERMGRPAKEFSPDAEAALLDNPFPGNVRELKNLVERAVGLSDGRRIEAHDLFTTSGQPAVHGTATLRNAKETSEREAILQALARHGWMMTETARALGISRKNLWEKMRRYGVERDAQ
ncbi:MAG TPA: sigma-54 dependent transcriptional regulator [Azospirillum sp.]|nr:sigma-54 dependent transcriptional regulator [Azospirillum sp.]